MKVGTLGNTDAYTQPQALGIRNSVVGSRHQHSLFQYAATFEKHRSRTIPIFPPKIQKHSNVSSIVVEVWASVCAWLPLFCEYFQQGEDSGWDLLSLLRICYLSLLPVFHHWLTLFLFPHQHSHHWLSSLAFLLGAKASLEGHWWLRARSAASSLL